MESQCSMLSSYAGHYYEVVAGNTEISNALANAAAIRSFYGVPGHLVNIFGPGEQVFVSQLGKSLLVGLTALIGGRRFANATFEFDAGPEAGVPFTFTNWDLSSDQPGSAASKRNCVAMQANGFWVAIDCNSVPSAFIVEYECLFGFKFGADGCYGLRR